MDPQTTETIAVSDVTFSIEPGEMVGYIGANGAGKSTTIKMLTGILTPTSGEISCNGFVPARERTRYVATIGVVFGQRTELWWDQPVAASFVNPLDAGFTAAADRCDGGQVPSGIHRLRWTKPPQQHPRLSRRAHR